MAVVEGPSCVAAALLLPKWTTYMAVVLPVAKGAGHVAEAAPVSKGTGGVVVVCSGGSAGG